MAQDIEKVSSTGQPKKVVGKGKGKATSASASAAKASAAVSVKTAAKKPRAAKPAAPKKPAAKQPGAGPTAAGGRAKAPARRPAGTQPITREERYRMVAEAAYLRAERRRFQPGGEVNDWFEAEAEVDAMLGARGVTLVD